MALPALAKTWEIVPNTIIPAGSNYDWHRSAMLAIVNVLTGFTNSPWVVVASSDSATSGWPGPGWSVYTDLDWNTAGNAHSWILLENAAGVQLCIDLAIGLSTCEKAYFWMSVAGFGVGAGGTDGSTTARPTATDEHEVGTVASPADAWCAYWTGDITFDTIMHAWHSTDGEVTRLVFYYQDVPCTIWRFEKIQNPRSGHATPYGFGVKSSYSANSVVSATYQEDNWQMMSDHGGLGVEIHPLGTGRTAQNLMEKDEMIVAEEIDGDMAFSEVGLSSPTVGARGPKGKCFDLWWGQYRIVADGDTYPNSPTAKEFVQVGALIFPWTGDATVMLTH
jgi:hypothetical protein